MAEEDLYEPIKERIQKLLADTGRSVYLEITASQGLSDRLKAKIPQGRDIVFMYLTKKPDVFGFVEGQYAADLVAIEVKEGTVKLDDIYQAKMYKEVLAARYAFLITTRPVPEEVKRLCKSTPDILHSFGDSTYRFLVIGEFEKGKGQFVDWFEENPFEKGFYWQ